MLPDFRLYYKAMVIKTVQYCTCTVQMYMDQWNRTESPARNPCSQGQLSTTEEAEIYNERKTGPLRSGCWENQTPSCERMKLELSLTPCIKISSKQIKDLNVRPETINLLEEYIGRTFFNIYLNKILFNPPHRVMEIKINKWDEIQLKTFAQQRSYKKYQKTTLRI